MRISVSIMTHFDRRSYAKALRDKLNDMWFKSVDIVYDVGLGEWDTGKRSLEQGIGKADWHIVLQDDAIISDTFFENVYSALLNVPERSLVSLYLGKVKPNSIQVMNAFRRASASDSSWISGNTLLWGVGIAIPSEDIQPVLECSKKYPNLLYDRRIGQYYTHNRRKVYYTTVSLVNHNYKLPSLTGHDTVGKPRVCHKFVGDSVVIYNSRFVAL